MLQIPKSADYLDEIIRDSIKAERRFRYDADIAEALNVSKSTLSLYRKGGNMSVLVAVKIASLLRIHPMETIAATMAHQSKGEEQEFWKECYTTFRAARTE